MKAKKLIINGEVQNLVSSVNGQTGDVTIPSLSVCELEITSISSHKWTISINSGELVDGAIIEWVDTIYNAYVYKFVYNWEEIPLLPYLNHSDGEKFTGIYKGGKVYIRRQFSTAV